MATSDIKEEFLHVKEHEQKLVTKFVQEQLEKDRASHFHDHLPENKPKHLQVCMKQLSQ